MPTKRVNLLGRQFEIEGVGADDPYFVGLSDNIDTDFTTIIKTVLPADSVVIDVGANIGVTSLILSRHVSRGRIYSYEPSPSVFPILSRNISRNNVENVQVHQNAVGAKEGKLGFVGESAYGHLVQASEDPKSPGEVTVDVVSIDDIVNSHELDRLDLIKIDVEGFEYDVLTGGQKTENRFSPLYYIEFNSFCLSAYGRINPFDLAQRIFDEFKYVYLVGINGNLQGPLGGPVDLVHTNIVHHGSVSNLLLTNSMERLNVLDLNSVVDWQRLMTNSEAERVHALAERDHARRYPWKYFFASVKRRVKKSFL